MRVQLFAILGAILGIAILVVAALTLNTTTLQTFQTLEQQAHSQDKGVASTSQQPCANPRLLATAPIRVLLKSQTEAITLQVTNLDTVECDITVSLVAPSFILQPKDNQQLLALASSASHTLVWRVTPTSLGLFTLAFTAGNANQQVGINVISGNALLPAQPQTLNYVGIFFGQLLALASLLVLIVAGRSLPVRHRSQPPLPRRQPTADTADTAGTAGASAAKSATAGATSTAAEEH